MAGAPRLSCAAGQLLRDLQVLDEAGEQRTLQVPIERPLKIVLEGQELVTLMTLGAAPELLVLGYLRNQRLIQRVTEIESVAVEWSANCAVVALRGTVAAAVGAQRAGAACSLGTVFSDWMLPGDAGVSADTGTASLGTPPVGTAHVGTPPVGTAHLSRAELLRILEVTREYDAVHRAAGSVHGCALFAGAELLVSIEDVSRHNGLDTVTGWMMLHGIAGADKTLFTTGRLTGEMVMKAAHNGVSIMVSRNGVTSMGYDLAVKLGMVLFGRAAKNRYFCYTGAGRLTSDPA